MRSSRTKACDMKADCKSNQTASHARLTVRKQTGSNMVGFNVSSPLTNFLPVVQTFAKTNKADFVKAFGQTVANRVGSIFGRGDTFAEDSPVMIRRRGADRFSETAWQKVGDVGYTLMSAIDNISTELIARTKYNEFIKQGMDSQKAHIETDKWTSRLMGDRSLGQMPQLYNSKTLGVITQFQLEVRNQLDSMFYDTIQEAKVSNENIENALKRNSKTAAKITAAFVELAVVQHLFGMAFENVAGYNPAFDIIEVIAKSFGWDDEEESEDTVLDNIEQGFFALLEDLPYTSTFTGGRIPLASALPISELVQGKDEYGNDKSRLETLKEAAPYYFLPGGYGQIKKTVGGIGMFDDEHPIAGSYTDKGNLRFPVDETPKTVIQAALFGQWANENARDYFDGNRAPLDDKHMDEFVDSGMSIQDYWSYQDEMHEIGDRISNGTATDDEIINYKYKDSLEHERAELYSQIQEIKESELSEREKEILIEDIREDISELNKAGFENHGNISYNDFNGTRYAEIGDGVFEWYVPEDEDKEASWRKLSDEQVAKHKATSQAGDAPYATDGTNHYRWYVPETSESGEAKEPYWKKISDDELERQNEVTRGLGITPEEYWGKKEEYSFAYDSPERYQIALAVGGYEAYTEYSSELNDIKSDYDASGKVISGSRKAKVLNYLNGLDADYGEKIILFKSEYPADDTYNYEIVDYLNSREDISYSQMETILKKLGFTVASDGAISWD